MMAAALAGLHMGPHLLTDGDGLPIMKPLVQMATGSLKGDERRFTPSEKLQKRIESKKKAKKNYINPASYTKQNEKLDAYLKRMAAKEKLKK